MATGKSNNIYSNGVKRKPVPVVITIQSSRKHHRKQNQLPCYLSGIPNGVAVISCSGALCLFYFLFFFLSLWHTTTALRFYLLVSIHRCTNRNALFPHPHVPLIDTPILIYRKGTLREESLTKPTLFLVGRCGQASSVGRLATPLPFSLSVT